MGLISRLQSLTRLVFDTLLMLWGLSLALTKAWYWEIWQFFTARQKSVFDQVVAITGGAGAIGRAVALKMVRKGAKVVLIDMDKKAVDKAIAGIRDQGFSQVLGFHCDCTRVENLERVAETLKTTADFGPVDILICCAGSLKAKTLLELTERDVRQSFDVNVISIFWAIKAFLPAMIEKGKGQVVAISSVAAHFGQSYSSAYSASKYAIRGVMESLMWEMQDLNKSQIKTTIIYPYFTKTPLLDGINPSSRFFDTLTVDYTAEEIVKNILYETEEAFVPHILGIFCLFIKQVSPGKVKAVWRNFFNVTYVDPTAVSAQSSPAKSSSQLSSLAELSTMVPPSDLSDVTHQALSSPSVACVVEKLIDNVQQKFDVQDDAILSMGQVLVDSGFVKQPSVDKAPGGLVVG